MTCLQALRLKPMDSQGFTLIELIVVMVIMGLGAALVGPQVANLHDKIMIQTEVETVGEFIEIAKIRAFARQKSLILNFSANEVTIKSENVKLKCRMLQFSPAVLTVNGNGFADIQKIRYEAKGEDKILDVPE